MNLLRQQPLTGYVLHARAYQERRAIYQIFTNEFGLVHGVGAKGALSFVLVNLFATGKNALKTFGQIQPASRFPVMPAGSMAQYALFYMNEVLCRLLMLENACPALWRAYHDEVMLLVGLNCPKDELMLHIKLSLRRFERSLFDELGVAIDFGQDSLGRAIIHDHSYHFIPEKGFVPIISTFTHQIGSLEKSMNRASYLGGDLIMMARADADEGIYLEKLDLFGRLQKDVMNHLLDYKPLHSRKLWQQSLRFKTDRL